MSASITQALSVTGTAQVVETTSLGTETPVNLNRKPITSRPLVASGYINLPIDGSSSGDIWPDAVSSIASGDVITFVLDFYHGSTDTTQANKAITVTVTAEVIKSWGDSLTFSESSVTTVVVARSAGAEKMWVRGYWYVYTV